MIAEAMRLPEIIRDARGEGFADHELKEALGETSGTPLEQDDASVEAASHRPPAEADRSAMGRTAR
jgi:C4-dicarboxylate transporter, DctQ subunit